MMIQTSTQPISISFLFTVLPQSDATLFSANDLGYEIGEDELAEELHTVGSGQPWPAAIPAVDPQEFDAAFHWFLA